MDISTKASITLSGKVAADEVRALVLAGVKAEANKGDQSGLTVVSSAVTLDADGSADVEIVYEKIDAASAAPAPAVAPAAAAVAPAGAPVATSAFHPGKIG